MTERVQFGENRLKCQEQGHDLNKGSSECLRCGMKANGDWRLLKFPVYFSRYKIFGDGLGDFGPRGVWYVCDAKWGAMVACGDITDARECAHEMELQDARDNAS